MSTVLRACDSPDPLPPGSPAASLEWGRGWRTEAAYLSLPCKAAAVTVTAGQTSGDNRVFCARVSVTTHNVPAARFILAFPP
jgi:hypothetical protein